MENPFFKKALEFIENTDLNTLETGRHEIDEGNVWVNIVECDLRKPEEALLEVHDRFADIHIPLSGPESYGVKDRALCISPKGVIDTANDILFFDDPIERTVTAAAGEMTVFNPDTAHAPMIGEGRIRKAIFKVRVC